MQNPFLIMKLVICEAFLYDFHMTNSIIFSFDLLSEKLSEHNFVVYKNKKRQYLK